MLQDLLRTGQNSLIFSRIPCGCGRGWLSGSQDGIPRDNYLGKYTLTVTAFQWKWDNPRDFIAAWFLYRGPEGGKILCFLLQEQPPPGAEVEQQRQESQSLCSPQHFPSPCQAHFCFILIKKKPPSKPELIDRKHHLQSVSFKPPQLVAPSVFINCCLQAVEHFHLLGTLLR